MSSTQLSFTLRTSANVKTAHLLGSWDGYKGQLPLSKDPSKAGAWRGTFRFSSTTLKPGQRYWYYYVMDGYHVSHDPAQPSTKEPTTGRSLNILDVPRSGGGGTPASTLSINKRGSGYSGSEVPKGRSLSPSKIAHPKPSKPYASRRVREADYSTSPGVDDIASQLEQASLYSPKLRNVSPPSSVGSSLSSRSSGGTSPSSLSSLSDQSSGSCRCNRWGVTRKGDRVRLDCGGSRCGYSDESSSACSSTDSESEEEEQPRYQEIRPRQRVETRSRR